VIGPAYAWSALLMRVNPQREYDLIERLRRDAVVGTLDKLNVENDAVARKDLLQSEWNDLLVTVSATRPDGHHQAFSEIVELVIEGVLQRVSFRLRNRDWELIGQLADKLMEFQPAAKVLAEMSKAQMRPTLRHVLNSGWVARLARPQADWAKPVEPQG